MIYESRWPPSDKQNCARILVHFRVEWYGFVSSSCHMFFSEISQTFRTVYSSALKSLLVENSKHTFILFKNWWKLTLFWLLTIDNFQTFSLHKAPCYQRKSNTFQRNRPNFSNSACETWERGGALTSQQAKSSITIIVQEYRHSGPSPCL